MKTFKSLGIDSKLISSFKLKGIRQTDSIQKQLLPTLFNTHADILMQSEKAFSHIISYGVLFIQNIMANSISGNKNPISLILVPTLQIGQEVEFKLKHLQPNKKLSIVTLSAIDSMEHHIKILKKSPDIIISTPNKLKKHIENKNINLDDLEYLVLENLDIMLKLGYNQELEYICGSSNLNKQIISFSSSMNQFIQSFSRKNFKKLEYLQSKQITNSNNLVEQSYSLIHENEKIDVLKRLLKIEEHFHGIIYVQNHKAAEHLQTLLINDKHSAAIVGDNISSHKKALELFKSKQINVLITQNLADVSLYVDGLTHIINYSTNREVDVYMQDDYSAKNSIIQDNIPIISSLMKYESNNLLALDNIDKYTKNISTKVKRALSTDVWSNWRKRAQNKNKGDFKIYPNIKDL